MQVDLERLLATNEKGVVILPHGKVYRIVAYAGSIRELVNQGYMLAPPMAATTWSRTCTTRR